MVITDAIMADVVSDVLSDMYTNITHVAYGTGTTTPDTTDTALETETFRNAKSLSSTTENSVRVIGKLAVGENNVSNAEIGTFDASSSGNMSMHNLLNAFVKTTSMKANYFIIGEVEVTQT